MELNIKNIDIKKADLGLRHEYIPEIPLNMAIEDESDKIIVDCEYFRLGEKMNYSAMSEDKEVTLDFQKVFRKKVKGIRNLVINGRPVTTSEELLKFPGVPELEALMMDVVLHIIRSDDLTEDEEKN